MVLWRQFNRLEFQVAAMASRKVGLDEELKLEDGTKVTLRLRL